MLRQKHINLTPKQRLILFFIESGFADTGYKLIKHLDRSAFFPSQLSKNLSPLLKRNFIEVSERLSNGNPFKYTITKQGMEYLDQNLTHSEIMDFVDAYSHKDFVMQVVPVLLEKRTAERKLTEGKG